VTTPELELARVLETYAGDAHAQPDLCELVESRYQRRRRRRTRMAGVAAGLVIVLAVAGIAVASPRSVSRPAVTTSPSASPSPSPSCTTSLRECDTAPLPTAPKFKSGHWTAPPAKIPPATSTWPTATFQIPARGPGGLKVHVVQTLDATHVLVTTRASGRITAYYSFDLTSGAFRQITRVPGKPMLSAAQAVSDNYLYWCMSGYNSSDWEHRGFDVYVAPLSGGPSRKIAHVAKSSYALSPWSATDDAVYWSYNGSGVVTLPRSGGQPTPVPGLADMKLIDGSGWAVQTSSIHGGLRVTTALKQIVTGRTLTVDVPDQVLSLDCTPAFCVGEYGHHNGRAGDYFIQDLDGGNRMALPKAPAILSFKVRTIGDRGLVEGYAELEMEFWDPFSGAAGRMVATWGADKSTSIGDVNQGDIVGAENGKTGIMTYLAVNATQ
jgi:hypothetical protein